LSLSPGETQWLTESTSAWRRPRRGPSSSTRSPTTWPTPRRRATRLRAPRSSRSCRPEAPVQTTDNPLDVVPEGDAFLAVATLKGPPAYTRNGKLNVNPDGALVADGRAVMGVSG